jgi:predicted ATP-grasp superfamily ATP-dependent carboligase
MAKSAMRAVHKPLEKIGEWIRRARRAKGDGLASDIGFIVDATPKKRFAEVVHRLLERGVDVRMMFAGDGFDMVNYPRQFHDAFMHLGIADKVGVAFLPDIDHVVTSLSSQARLIDHTVSWAASVARIAIPRPSRPVNWNQGSRSKLKPAAIVLSRTITGLGTIRSLGRAGVEVHAFYFDRADPVRFSRYCRPVLLEGLSEDHEALLDKLISYAKELGNRPVVFPASDAHALMLAGAREKLGPYCRIVTDSYEHMAKLISKDGLFEYAHAAAVNLIPYIIAPTLAEATEWTTTHSGPYLVKPFYTGVSTARMTKKNQVFENREELLRYVEEGSMNSLIVQRMIRGGDGNIFDCYGYCDRTGRLVSMVSRRRIRQLLPDYGTCTFGELPAAPEIESVIFAGTRRLLEEVGYHGIFDIEWLRDRETGELYLIDFNARPAMGITHLTAAGLNLPALAYDDLTGKDLSSVDPTPRLPHLRAMDIWRDIESFVAKRKRGEITLREWLASIATCRHFYYMTWRDPMPGVARQFEALRRSLRFFARRVFRWRRSDQALIGEGL